MSTLQLVGLRQKKKGYECVCAQRGGGGALRDGVKLLPAGVYVSLGVAGESRGLGWGWGGECNVIACWCICSGGSFRFRLVM